MRVTSPIEQVTRRPWRKLYVEVLRQEIVSSSLCQHDLWPSDTDMLAELFDNQMNNILDKLIPYQQVVRRQCSSDAWFDVECRDAKRLTRRLECAYAAAVRRNPQQPPEDFVSATRVDDAKAVWYAQRRSYRDLVQRKRRAYWVDTIETNRNSPKRLWSTVDLLLG